MLAFATATAVCRAASAETPAASTTIGAAEGSPPMTEQEVFDRWLRSSPEIASWRTQIGSARFDVLTAKLWPNPELQVFGTFFVDGTPTNGNASYTAQVSVPLPIFGQVAARREAATSLVSVAEMNVLATIWERAADIQQGMVERAFAASRVAMLERNLGELDRIQKIVQTRMTAGASSEYDVLRVETAAGTARAALGNALIERDKAEANVLSLVADPTLTAANVGRDGLATFHGPDNEGTLVEMALARRPDLNLAKRGALAFEASARRYRSDAVPTPSLIAGGTLTGGPYGLMVTGGLSIPLPVADRNQGLVGRALSDAQGQAFLVSALETRIRREVSSYYRARRHGGAALEQFRSRSMAAATALLGRAEVTYQAGKFSIAELFDAYQTMWDARQQELELERQRADAEAQLERAAVLLPLVTR